MEGWLATWLVDALPLSPGCEVGKTGHYCRRPLLPLLQSGTLDRIMDVDTNLTPKW